MDIREFARYVKDTLDNAYGGVKQWSEADAFEGIYAKCDEILNDQENKTPDEQS